LDVFRALKKKDWMKIDQVLIAVRMLLVGYNASFCELGNTLIMKPSYSLHRLRL